MNTQDVLWKIVHRIIQEVPNDARYSTYDSYFRAGVDEGVDRAVKIISEYMGKRLK